MMVRSSRNRHRRHLHPLHRDDPQFRNVQGYRGCAGGTQCYLISQRTHVPGLGLESDGTPAWLAIWQWQIGRRIACGSDITVFQSARLQFTGSLKHGIRD
jgi:hypothetical protein